MRRIVEMLPVIGEDINDVVAEAIYVAKREDVVVRFTVNGVELRAFPSSSVLDLVTAFRDGIGRPI